MTSCGIPLQILQSKKENNRNVEAPQPSHSGLAAAAINSMLVTDRSRLEDNTAGGSGGAISLNASQLVMPRIAAVTWDGMSTLINNTASMKGGGLYAVSHAVHVSLLGKSEWTDNTAQDGGGAMYIEAFNLPEEASSVRIGGASQLSRNGAKNGGAIYVNGFADIQVGEGSDISLNTAKYDGGAVFLAQLPSEILVQSSSVSNNTAHRGSGGAFYVGTVEPVFLPHATDPSCTLYGDNMNISILNSSFVGNIAGVADGGALYLKPHETCSSETSALLQIDGSIYTQNTALGAGGAIAVRDASNSKVTVSISNSAFKGNTAGTVAGDFTSSANFGGALMIWHEPTDSGGNFTDACHLAVDNTSFQGNSCDGGTGGALMLISCASRFSRCNFTDNHATHSGGAMGALQMARSTATLGLVTTSAFAAVANGAGFSQQAQSMSGQQPRLLLDGDFITQRQNPTQRRIDAIGKDADLSNSRQNGRRKLWDETECSISSESSTRWNVKLEKCIFSQNSADREYGGALYLYMTSGNGQIRIASCSFEKNRAVLQRAGAVFLAARGANASVEVFDSSFNRNAADLSSAGALYALVGQDACATLVNLSMISNQAAVSAGASVLDVRSNGFVRLENSIGGENHAAGGDGGAVLLQLQKDAHAFISNCNFSDNSAAGNGGALLVDANCSSSLLVEKSIMNHNHAGLSGGAIYALYGSKVGQVNCSSLVLSHSTIQNSSTSGSGGGFWAYGCRRLLLEYVNITGNIARVSGGGLTFSGPTDDIAAEGLTGNTALGGETPQYTSMIVHRARVHDNAAALSSDALEGCQGKDSFQPGEKGKGGGFFITGKVAGVLSLVNLEQPNYASLGSAIASTQRCKQASLSNAASNGLVGTDDVRVRNWDESWALLDSLATANCWLLQLGDTLLPSVTLDAEGMTQPSPQQKHTIWMEDFLASALQVSCNGKWEILESLYDAGEDEAAGHYDDDVPLLVKTFLADSITQRANDNPDFIAGQVLTMATPDGKLPGAAAVAAGLSQKWFDQLLSQLSSCMRNQQPTSDKQHSAMRQQSYLALPAAYMGLRLLDTDLVYSQRLQLQPGFAVNLTAQLYDMSGQAVTWGR
ncbi:hypothetical protein VOLCADRAFT_96555 [Volvox carteri f. nagariensis]|uniref:Right handed beta helix domain-containing protein n=1 Tax=Volvox carteri f. nagariensis TaxID=3068 RepID=D8UAE7_VOLCA|nr:uncharacterized protein VOLCADRAFT_96555 [Volvox carteri f. nagariensis]EFJ43304.1 hypothetical protein VOLCADRAFT_96555 [Volvox carteri f. nagariensis]|eukprot:XP_002955664.1 hypothetical protein VOLCADRAFT_96555 [Volvox carteri f. nagariensis]